MGAAPRWAGLAERRQVPLYLLAIALGVLAGLVLPALRTSAEHAIEPVLAALLYVTFLGVPFTRLREGVRDGRFLLAVLGLNFLLVPALVALVMLLAPAEQGVRLGMLLVLLTPCVDYVIVFARLAGGAAERLLVAAPLLMVVQMLLLPLYLLLIADSATVAAVEPGPFLRALVVLVVLPLLAAVATQALGSRHAVARRLARAPEVATVPLMMLTLAVVVTSQIGRVVVSADEVLALVPLYAGWFVVLPLLGLALARLLRFDVARTRALMFSGATRNSLVVLPLALALPPALALAPAAVVTQTLVELVAMVVMVRLVPRLARRAAP